MRKRARYTRLVEGVVQVRLHFGFIDEPDVPACTVGSDDPQLRVRSPTTSPTSSVSETVTAGKAPGMHPLREELFVLLNRGAANAARFFNLPPDRVFEVGTHVEI